MAESSIASAVALPEPPQYPSPEALPKRRQSTSSNSSSKRRRLSADGVSEHATQSAIPSYSSDTRRPNDSGDVRAANQPRTGRDEERKRGRRLFGALLGTLSQSSSTPAQRKRSEIDRKQQAKLKLQDKEYNELTKKKYEDLLAARRKDQVLYDSQSTEIRHANALAMANFLQTKAEPPLYYRPWYLRPQDETKIQSQIAEVKTSIEKERMNSSQHHQLQHEPVTDERKSVVEQSNINTVEDKATKDITDPIGSNTDALEQTSEAPERTLINTTPVSVPLAQPQSPSGLDEEHSGEVLMENTEDAVIY
ncbi:pinin/SDK/memA domain-containing protein [Nannizzia gypsea CBS 118893]|uniref:Pinin/SDK/memA domain-containing protein n=1 Tax=Arthroderma gypseum (strain ATCC MYA-4604 / CBS 118893) TaxID=535722 RepID=E4V421_ARTGP|nr:pinin/SDK/memA domain-containing protein [Nannizzia gypsea CBS 118893]EFR04745.1 pinin/SDK/memA domain-containing protein [Nannizzia gypsea CBS 118893]